MQQQIIIDRAPLRGEYKLWIYKRYLVQSIHFFLSVNNIPSIYNHFENAEYGYEEDQEMAGSHSVNYCSSHPSS